MMQECKPQYHALISLFVSSKSLKTKDQEEKMMPILDSYTFMH